MLKLPPPEANPPTHARSVPNPSDGLALHLSSRRTPRPYLNCPRPGLPPLPLYTPHTLATHPHTHQNCPEGLRIQAVLVLGGFSALATSADKYREAFQVNVIAPLRVTQALVASGCVKEGAKVPLPSVEFPDTCTRSTHVKLRALSPFFPCGHKVS